MHKDVYEHVKQNIQPHTLCCPDEYTTTPCQFNVKNRLHHGKSHSLLYFSYITMTSDVLLSQLLDEVCKDYKESGSLSDNVLSALHFFAPVVLQNSLDLIDRENVSLLTAAKSGRHVYQVRKKPNILYVMLPCNPQ